MINTDFHLKELLDDTKRNKKLRFEFSKLNLHLDCTHTKIDEMAFEML